MPMKISLVLVGALVAGCTPQPTPAPTKPVAFREEGDRQITELHRMMKIMKAREARQAPAAHVTPPQQ